MATPKSPSRQLRPTGQGQTTKAKVQAPVADNFYHAVWQIVRSVPRGRVVTYGQIATWLGSPRAARAVGYALLHAHDPKLPWHRVINAQGKISEGGHLHRPDEQKRRLQREKIRFDAQQRIDLRRYGWQLDPDAATTRMLLRRLGLSS